MSQVAIKKVNDTGKGTPAIYPLWSRRAPRSHWARRSLRLPAPSGKSVINEIQPRVQLVNLPSKILVCSFAGPLECIAQFALEHADSRGLAHDPTILSRNVRFHLPDLQATF